VENLALAAGTLSTTRIVLESIYRESGKVERFHGLMDNRQILVPYLNLRLIGAGNEPRNYQYHQVAMGLESEDGDPKGYVHGQITTLTTGLVHPIIQNLPLNLGTALYFFRNVRAALGVVNINLHDTRRPENYVTIEPVPGGGPSRLVARYASTSDEPARIKRVLARTKQALWKLGCIVPPPMVHVRHMGAGVHYSGTLPMSKSGTEHTVTAECRSNDFTNLYIADGSSFPFLPAKNLTFTLMANATRAADLAAFA
jgi:choline dehydrogenase-like flavoprotein